MGSTRRIVPTNEELHHVLHPVFHGLARYWVGDGQDPNVCPQPLILGGFWYPVSRPTHFWLSPLDPCVFPSQVVVGGAVEEYQSQLVIMLWRAQIRIQLMH